MGDNLVAYIERLELLAFFAGYPLLYSAVHFINRRRISASSNRLLPYAYALTGTLFLGLLLRNISSDMTSRNFQQHFSISLIQLWGVSAVLFWIPVLAKKTVYSLVHSSVFFFLLLKDIFWGGRSLSDRNIVRNDMKIYTISLLINFACLCTICLYFFIRNRLKRHNGGKFR